MTMRDVPIFANKELSSRYLWLEGLRIFFPVSAAYLALWPFLWAVIYAFDLPFARAIPVTQWHAYEMLVGGLGAALAGFLTSAVPEWTGTPPRTGKDLQRLVALWALGRPAGLLGADALLPVALLTDAAFFALLAYYIARPLVARRASRHYSFAAWLAVLAMAAITVRIAWMLEYYELSAQILAAMAHVYVILFALALGRINIAIINLALDPSGRNTHYRPHPGRQTLAAGMAATFAIAALLFPQSSVPGWLAFASAAAFFDRLAEWFIGRAFFKPQILALAGANLMAGAGYALLGLSYFAPNVSPTTGLHVLTLGALGLGVLSVFVIAGLRHTGRDVIISPSIKIALGLVPLAAALRALPGLGITFGPAMSGYEAVTVLWGVAFLIWLAIFLPYFLTPTLWGSPSACT